MTNINRRLRAVATGQLGLLSRQQAKGVGISDAQLRNRVSSGSLLRVGVDTFRFPEAPSGSAADLRALLFDVGGDAWVSGPTAAALHGFDGFRLAPPFHVTIESGRSVKRVGHHIHTTARLELIDRAEIDGMAVTSAARTLIDLARSETVERLTVAFDSGLRDGRFNESLLHRRIVALRTRGRHGIPRLIEAIEGVETVRGGHSWLEREYLRLVAAAGLPRPDPQQVLARAGGRVVRVDFRFPGTPVVVEVLGYRYHRTPDQLRRDAERMNALVAAGLRPYQFAYEHVVQSPDRVVAETRAALAAWT